MLSWRDLCGLSLRPNSDEFAFPSWRRKTFQLDNVPLHGHIFPKYTLPGKVQAFPIDADLCKGSFLESRWNCGVERS